MNENQRIGAAWADAIEWRERVLAMFKEASAAQEYAAALQENASREWSKMNKAFVAAEACLYKKISGVDS